MPDPSTRSPIGVADAAWPFEARTPVETVAWLEAIRPPSPALVLDIGMDAARASTWAATRGLDVVAIASRSDADPGRVRSSSIRWIDDRLPALEKTYRLGATFDFILLGEPWNRVAPTEKARAFRKLVTLLKPGGRLAIDHSLPANGEIESLAREHGLIVENSGNSADVTRTRLLLRLPDDGTGALPLLRHIILNDQKSATYKLALLRVLCRIADGAAGLAHGVDDKHVGVPLGLVALYWVRLYKPLLAAGLPQSPDNVGDRKLGFVRDGGFRALRDVSHLDLRVGMLPGADVARVLHRTLCDAARHIEAMPAHFTTYATGGAVFPIRRGAMPRAPARAVRLDGAYLFSFGTMLVPRHLWRAFQRFDVWIEPSLTAEWKRLIGGYAFRQDRNVAPETIDRALVWSDPERDVKVARQRALQLLEARQLHCVWTGRRLSPDSLDIDHCFPWSAWPCEDLWNLMPSHRQTNQRDKRERLPGIGLLRDSQERIVEWWNDSYLSAKTTLLPERFIIEAQATLPTLGPANVSPEDVFLAVTLQQARLRHDQQVPVWEPRSDERE